MLYYLHMSTDNIPTKHPHVKIVRHIVPDPQENNVPKRKDAFHKLSVGVSNKLGSPYAFLIAALIIVGWAATGPLFDFSDTWQLVINTGTTIVTFLMVFAIQNTQNRDSKAVQLKLNELIKSSHGARTEFVDVEDLTDSELEVLHGQFKEMHDKFRSRTPNKQ